jgi:putative ABC transport system permease protein
MMEIRPIFSAMLRNKTAPILVAMQVAISLAILANAAYVVNLRMENANRPSGVREENNIFRVQVTSNRQTTASDAFAEQKHLSRVISAVPGVLAVSLMNQSPLSQSGHSSSVKTLKTQTQPVAEVAMYQSPDSPIQTLGLNLIAGRDFNRDDIIEQDEAVASQPPRTVIISQALAQRAYPDAASVIGKQIFLGGPSDEGSTIVGVVDRLLTQDAQNSIEGEFSAILPIRDNQTRNFYLIRTEPGQRDRVIAEVENAIRKANNFPVRLRTGTMEGDRKNRYRNDVALAWMLVAVSVLLLLVTASGIVGMTSLWVTQRRKQIGVRRALGARRVDILRYFLTENVMISCFGIASGALLALGLNQVLVSQLELPRLPVGYLLSGAGTFVLLGLAAVYVPAWRAASISPAVATRGV